MPCTYTGMYRTSTVLVLYLYTSCSVYLYRCLSDTVYMSIAVMCMYFNRQYTCTVAVLVPVPVRVTVCHIAILYTNSIYLYSYVSSLVTYQSNMRLLEVRNRLRNDGLSGISSPSMFFHVPCVRECASYP